MSLRSTVFFSGYGGDCLGWMAVPGLTGRIAANHNPVCVAVHELNFPMVEHLPPGDVRDIDLTTLPATEMFWASPACPEWTDAKGQKRYFDQSNQYRFDEELGIVEDPASGRSRALVEQIPRYLRAMAARGKPVLAGVMENVVQCWKWDDPLAANTLERIRIGIEKFAGAAMLAPAGGTWRTEPTGLGEPMPTRTTRETDALVIPPLVVQTSGRAAPTAVTPVSRTLPTQTCRRELSVVIPPFIAELRGGGSKKSARSVTEPLATFAANGFHHGLVQSPADPTMQLLVPYYRTGRAHPVSEPLGTLTTRDRYALVGADMDRLVADSTFRMLAVGEIRAGMAIPASFKALGDKRTQARGFGNAVTPAAAEVLGCALVEAITGIEIERTAA